MMMNGPEAADGFAAFLDFDGTLVDIAPTPDGITVPGELGVTLNILRERLGGALAIVSGRGITTLDRFLAPHRFDMAGLHGAELRVAGRDIATARPVERLTPIVAALRHDFPASTGVIVEDKGKSVALHWRLAPDHAMRAKARAVDALAALGHEWRLQPGKDVIEILPAKASKGSAIARILDMPPFTNRRPFYVGDDLTDEHGFETVLERGGVAVAIGEGTSIAPVRLPSPAALREQLAAWAAGRGPSPDRW